MKNRMRKVADRSWMIQKGGTAAQWWRNSSSGHGLCLCTAMALQWDVGWTDSYFRLCFCVKADLFKWHSWGHLNAFKLCWGFQKTRVKNRKAILLGDLPFSKFGQRICHLLILGNGMFFAFPPPGLPISLQPLQKCLGESRACCSIQVLRCSSWEHDWAQCKSLWISLYWKEREVPHSLYKGGCMSASVSEQLSTPFLQRYGDWWCRY